MGSKWENLPAGEDSRSSPAPGALLGPRRQSQTVRVPAWPGWGRVGKEPEGGPMRSRHAGSRSLVGGVGTSPLDHGELPEGLAGGDRDSICDVAQVKREREAHGQRGGRCHGGEKSSEAPRCFCTGQPLLRHRCCFRAFPPSPFLPPLPAPSFSLPLSSFSRRPSTAAQEQGSASASLPSSPDDFLRSPCTPTSLCAPSQAWGPSGSRAGAPELSPDVMDFLRFFCLGCRPIPAPANRAAVRGPQTRV